MINCQFCQFCQYFRLEISIFRDYNIEKQIGKLVRNVGLVASGFCFFMVLERNRQDIDEEIIISVTLWRR